MIFPWKFRLQWRQIDLFSSFKYLKWNLNNFSASLVIVLSPPTVNSISSVALLCKVLNFLSVELKTLIFKLLVELKTALK